MKDSPFVLTDLLRESIAIEREKRNHIKTEMCGECTGSGWSCGEACHACWGKGVIEIDDRPNNWYTFKANNGTSGDHIFVRPELPETPKGYALHTIAKPNHR